MDTTKDQQPAEPQSALTDLEKGILSMIQSGFPVAPHPYAEIGKEQGATEEESFAVVNKLREEGVIRRMGAIFDSYKLGYQSTLCAIAVPEDRVEEVAAHISSYPNVTHNYLRENRYNVWFTLIAPSKERITEILGEIAEHTGITDILDLPAIRLFKIRVDFDLTGKRAAQSAKPPVIKPAEVIPTSISPQQKALVRLLQEDITGQLTPFATIAQSLREQGFEADEQWVIDQIDTWKAERTIRRFGAAIKHHKTGYTFNAMGVWDIPEDRLDEVGPIMASFKEVSHCYQRPSYPTWPANTYTMIHGTSKRECEEVAGRIRREIGVEKPPFLLYSTREFKKSSMRYFTES